MSDDDVTEWELSWTSTPYERYSTNMNERAFRAAKKLGFTVTGSWGGSMVNYPDDAPGGADNGLSVKATEKDARELAVQMGEVVGHEVAVRRVGKD